MSRNIDIEEGLMDFFRMKDSGFTMKKLDAYYTKWEDKKGRGYVATLRKTISTYAETRQVISRSDNNVSY